MSSDTESSTDSDTSNERDVGLATATSSPVGNTKYVTDEISGVTYGRAMTAVTRLQGIDGQSVLNDRGIHDEIYVASNTIIQFIDAACINPKPGDARTRILSFYCSLVHVSNLRALFVLRRSFQMIAMQATKSEKAPSVIVSWVDVLLAKLSSLTMLIASGFSLSIFSGTLSGRLKSQLEDDYLHAATQLPEKWQDLPHTFQSTHTSPAARRLTLQLLFSAYIMGPQLGCYDPWNPDSILPGSMLEILYCSSEGTIANILSQSMSCRTEQDKITCAMYVSLFSSLQKLEIAEATPPLRPHTFGLILDAIHFVMHSNSSTSSQLGIWPYQALDLPQIILLRWGQVINWCWTVWDDQRTANVEDVLSVTTSWLYHLNTSFLAETVIEGCGPFVIDLRMLLLTNQTASSAAILQVLHHTVSVIYNTYDRKLDPALVVVLHKTCWSAVQMSQANFESDGASHQTPHLAEFCRCLLLLFPLLENNEAELAVKDLVLEFLTWCGFRHVEDGIKRIRSETDSCFVPQLNQAMIRTKGVETTSNLDRVALNTMLNFVTILWHIELDNYVQLKGAISSFIEPFIESILRWPNNKSLDTPLLRSLMNLLSSTKNDNIKLQYLKREQDGGLWRIAMKGKHNDFLTASSFANFIVMNNIGGRSGISPFFCVEIWNYLRDVLILIMSDYITDEEEPLGLFICPHVCAALVELLGVDQRSTQFIIDSPWTLSLCKTLRAIVENTSLSTVYLSTLTRRLRQVGNLLINQIAGQMGQKQNSISRGDKKFKNARFLFYSDFPFSGLILDFDVEE